MIMLKTNTKAPDFTLYDQDGKEHMLSQYRGSWVLVYFYPKDDTPGCTVEACQIRDNFGEFKRRGIVVLGISTDGVRSHRKFAKKISLPFALLADDEKKVVNLYGVWSEKTFMGRTYMGTLRDSFLINPEGKLVKIYEKVKPDGHAAEVLGDVLSFRARP